MQHAAFVLLEKFCGYTLATPTLYERTMLPAAGAPGNAPPRTKRQRVSGPLASPPGTSAKRSRPDGIAQRLLDRQTGASSEITFERRCLRERFSNFRLGRRLDLLAGQGGRSRVMEIVAVGPTVFGLTENGTCVAFDTDTGKRICLLNTDPTEVVRSLFHNKTNATLITVSVHAADSYSSLRCRANPLSQLRAGVANAGTTLFATESLRWPGFVEFDDVNSKVVTYSADCGLYKVWALSDPSKVLYQLAGEHIDEIKISPGIMLVVLNRVVRTGHVPLKLLSIETGETLVELDQPTVSGKKIEFIEQFNEKLLIKQEDSPLKIVDLLTRSVVTVPAQQFQTPSAFIFLYENQTFLAFRKHEVTVWNFRGELVSRFEDHSLWFPLPELDHTSVIYITQTQDVIFSLCQGNSDDAESKSSHNQTTPKPTVAIHVSHILSGKRLAKIDWKSAGSANLTALYYNEERGDIITGNTHGVLQVWSN